MIQPTLVNLQSSKYSEDFSTIRLHKDVLEVVILLRTYLIKYVSQTEQYVSQSMCPKQNRRFKSKRVQHDYRNKSIKKLTKHIMQM